VKSCRRDGKKRPRPLKGQEDLKKRAGSFLVIYKAPIHFSGLSINYIKKVRADFRGSKPVQMKKSFQFPNDLSKNFQKNIKIFKIYFMTSLSFLKIISNWTGFDISKGALNNII